MYSSKFQAKERSSNTKEICKSEDEKNVEIDWEGELINASKELQKSRKRNKALKEQLQKVEEQAKQSKVKQEALERNICAKEKEFEEHLNCAQSKIKRLEEHILVLKNSIEET